MCFFFFSSRRRHTRFKCDWSSDVCSSDLLRDLGPLAFLSDGEPFAGCLFHEMVISDGRKMSKHLGNVVDPDELVERYGADTVRLAVLYAARPQRSLNWSDSSLLRCHRFLTQVWEYSHAKLADLQAIEQSTDAGLAASD